jgi:threonine dehydrogenase-like Zn-dependent dehydrogenase
VFGAGPVGLFAAKSAWLMGAGRVIVIDHIDYRLEFARAFANAETINFSQVNDIVQWVKEQTGFLGDGGLQIGGRQSSCWRKSLV